MVWTLKDEEEFTRPIRISELVGRGNSMSRRLGLKILGVLREWPGPGMRSPSEVVIKERAPGIEEEAEDEV